jgi:hypothetical protein
LIGIYPPVEALAYFHLLLLTQLCQPRFQFRNLFFLSFSFRHFDLGADPDQKPQRDQHEQNRIDFSEYLSEGKDGVQKGGHSQEK